MDLKKPWNIKCSFLFVINISNVVYLVQVGFLVLISKRQFFLQVRLNIISFLKSVQIDSTTNVVKVFIYTFRELDPAYFN